MGLLLEISNTLRSGRLSMEGNMIYQRVVSTFGTGEGRNDGCMSATLEEEFDSDGDGIS